MATYTYKYGKILDEIKAQQSFVRLSIDKVFSTISGHIRTRYINRLAISNGGILFGKRTNIT